MPHFSVHAIAVVELIRIAIVTNRYTDHPLAARLSRLGREGADFCFDRDELHSPRQLYEFVVNPRSQRSGARPDRGHRLRS